MDYEKKYKEALERAMKFLNKELFAKNSECAIKHIFPELKESEDEKIRKELIDIVAKSPITFAFEDKNKVLSWLEKQGEKKPQRIISAEAKEAMYNKPAWSEEDERNFNDAILFIETGTYSLDKDNLINWLKSLRPQWKPSDEQMVVLELASKYERVFTPKQIDILIGLKEQLKKLKGE